MPKVREFVAQEDVLGHRQPVDQVELLVDGGDARRIAACRVVSDDLLAVPGDLALVGLVRARPAP